MTSTLVEVAVLAGNSSASQEMLLNGIVQAGHFDARALPELFRCVVSHLAEVRHVFAGRIALAHYCRAQCTDQVTLRIATNDGIERLRRELDDIVAAALPATSSVRLEATFLEESSFENIFFEHVRTVPWFGVDARIATPEHLLWLALSSRQPADLADADNLLCSMQLDASAIARLFRSASPTIARRLIAQTKRSKRTGASTFSSMMERRMRETR